MDLKWESVFVHCISPLKSVNPKKVGDSVLFIPICPSVMVIFQNKHSCLINISNRILHDHPKDKYLNCFFLLSALTYSLCLTCIYPHPRSYKLGSQEYSHPLPFTATAQILLNLHPLPSNTNTTVSDQARSWFFYVSLVSSLFITYFQYSPLSHFTMLSKLHF